MAQITDVIRGTNLGPSFDLSNGTSIEIRTGQGLTVAPDGTISVLLAQTTTTIYHECYAGGSDNGQQSGAWARNSTATRLSAGRWQITFDTAHPDGTDYHVSLGAEESNVTRDNPKMIVEQGSKTATGFTVMLTTDDNGGAADPYSDQPFSYGVDCPETVVTGVTPV